ncbi:5'-methylthioadenosine/S-adenosylhomocysteine nucleosidase [Sphingomicrobium sediminis]|uniref:5'-methylthioadenosine/S-adenosylhomocysteine nucleosidase n=1 Tax=Sphingomicrobium sediminis TaxID=2950949 RepID=A0A9X2J3F8_9SPHN|nr:5'-methylthioadenosine/S-adenosylhomocysteine nucleosidase [Sphingomicrobium sediminis]MCM8558010.1 5'-methylthioadenosine/S-adenosylhomocysteine nucleosidase [Sphingomicrobium sediminis]
MPKIGIVTGLLEEADAFRPGVGRIRREMPFYFREDEDFMLACAGIGKVNGSMAASTLVSRGCDLLVSMGSAGRIGKGEDQAYWLGGAYQHDYGACRREEFVAFRAGSLPFGEPDRQPFLPIDNPGLDLPTATIITGDCFIEDEGRAGAMSLDFDAELVDMETGAVAQVAAMHNIGWAGVRAVSDGANEDGANEFKTQLLNAARMAASQVDKMVQLLQRV